MHRDLQKERPSVLRKRCYASLGKKNVSVGMALTLSEVASEITSLLEELDSLHGQLDSSRPDNEVWQDLSGLERRDYAARIEALCDSIHMIERKLEELNCLHCDSNINFNSLSQNIGFP